MKAVQILDFLKHRVRGGARLFSAIALFLGIAGPGFVLVVDSKNEKEAARLEADVRTLNVALSVHRIFNGSVKGAVTPDDVLAKLQALDLETACIDRRLRAQIQDSEDAASGAPRAVWNRVTNRFEVTCGVVRGVKRFYLDTNLDPDRIVEERRIAKLNFEANESWMWDYEEEIEPVVKSLKSHSSKIGPADPR